MTDTQLVRADEAERNAAQSETTIDTLLREAAHVSQVPLASRPRELAPGVHLCDGRFEVIRAIAAGGMGTVYEAHDHEAGLRVALKLLHGASPVWLRRLRREFVLLHDLAHPNLIQLGELLESGGSYFFTMELLDGVDFLSYVRPEDELDAGRLRDALLQLGEALDVLTTHGMVHGDIKPSNIIVTGEHRLVLLDFGLGRNLSGDTRHTEAGGTYAYMAPEKRLGDPGGAAADWYSVGVMLHVALTGSYPGPGAALFGEPPELASLCQDLLQDDPKLRPTSAGVLQRLGQSHEQSPFARDIPFVGREHERAVLMQALEQSRRGPAIVHVDGESGVGKTTLLSRFAGEARRHGALVLDGRCYERMRVPFKAFHDLAEALARYLQSLHARERAELLPEDAGLLHQLLPTLADALSSATAPHIPDDYERRERAFLSLRKLLARIAATRPLVLIIDDVQWSDADGLLLISDLTSQIPFGARLLLVLGSRATVADMNDALGGCDVTELPLMPLARKPAHELATRLGERIGMSAELAGQVASSAGGHPFHMMELIHCWHQRQDEELPSVAGAISDRVSRLSGLQRRVLELASLAGAPIAQKVLREATEVAPERFAAALAGLRGAHLLTTGSRLRDAVEPYHDRVRAAVVARIAEEAQPRMHARLGAALEAAGDHEPALILYHLEAAGAHERAGLYARAAAVQAYESLAFERAAELFGEALRLRSWSPDETAKLYEQRAAAHVDAGDCSAAADSFALAASLHDGSRSLDMRQRAAEQLMRAGRYDEGIETIASVLDEAGLPPLPSRRWALWRALTEQLRLRARGYDPSDREPGDMTDRQRRSLECCWSAGLGMSIVEPLRGAGYQSRHLRMALNLNDRRRIALGLCLEAGRRAIGGPPADAAHELLARARTIVDELGEPQPVGFFHLSCAVVAFCTGEWLEAGEHARTAERIFRDECVGVSWELGTSQRFYLATMFHVGRIEELRRRTRYAVKEAINRGDLHALTQLRTGPVPTLALMDDNLDGAREALAWVESRLQNLPTNMVHWQGLQSRVLVSLYAGEPDAALQLYADSWRSIRRAFLFHFKIVRIFSRFLRATASLALAAQQPAEARASVERADRDRKRLIREGGAAPAVHMLSAQLALAHGDRDHAVESFEAAMMSCQDEGLELMGAVARWRWGELAGGRAGRAATDQAHDKLLAEGVGRPDRVIGVFAPYPA